jgi:hypothetical protein
MPAAKVLLHVIGADGSWDHTAINGDATQVGELLQQALVKFDHEGAHLTAVMDVTQEDVYLLAHWLREGMPIAPPPLPPPPTDPGRLSRWYGWYVRMFGGSRGTQTR